MTPQGRETISKFGFPNYIDGSCRREPDLEIEYPSITSLCRKNKLAPSLNYGDIVIYLTVKAPWGNIEAHWRLTAILEVYKRFENHEQAANWYLENGLGLPSNCMVSSNPPLPIDRTGGIPIVFKDNISEWDKHYQNRCSEFKTFIICKPQYKNLHEPPILTSDMLINIFGKVPGTQNPKIITEHNLKMIKRFANII